MNYSKKGSGKGLDYTKRTFFFNRQFILLYSRLLNYNCQSIIVKKINLDLINHLEKNFELQKKVFFYELIFLYNNFIFVKAVELNKFIYYDNDNFIS